MKSKCLVNNLIRLCDLIIALLALVLFLPLFAFVAVLVKISSPGTVFFSQNRVGQNGRLIRILKFRSMVPSAEKAAWHYRTTGQGKLEPVIKDREDKRITSVGRVLRRYSIDELPQLFNILKGEMSLVGARPPVLEEFRGYNEYQRSRLTGKPGLTGLAQIIGRTDLDFDRIVAYDRYYIQNHSLALYFKILVLTIPLLLSGKSAY
jgi:lipopolysaccharide/colanic/teichoic acid biosynthesis glycosyltransferase